MIERIVFDASAGVKWFKRETESEEAWSLLDRHASDELDIHMPGHCIGEVLAVVSRRTEPMDAVSAWVSLSMAGVVVRNLDDYIMRESARQMTLLDCDFYDALAPALATLLDAPLYSADRRAHEQYPKVHFLGE